jgi:ubiquinone/menaquinone biosynthesis C-methylase UbiE
MKPDFQRRIQRYGWDKAAPYYEDSWQEQLWAAQKRFLEVSRLKRGQRVLDVACGTGLVTFPASRTIAPGKITGVDISDRMVETARKVAKKENINAEFKRMEAEKLDLPDNTFDIALCSLGIMYVPDPVQALKEIHRVLVPGGRAIALVWGKRSNCGWAEIFPIVDRRVQSDVCPLFFQQGTGSTLKNSFQSAGFVSSEDERFRSTLHFDSGETACNAAFRGGPVALAYRKFNETVKSEVHAEYLDSIKRFQNGIGYDIPGEFVIASGYKVK